MHPSTQRQSEGGYAILLVLLGAALMAVYLVRALPREAMSAQRIREERLIDRGEQYKRAIQLYFRENKKYPEEIDDLEETNGVRYLRRRYKDPMTGEDEWRLIHIGTNGRFKDSLIYDLEDPEELQSADGRMGAGGSGLGGRSRSASRGTQAPNQPMDAATYQALYGATQPAQPGVFQGANRARQTRESAAPDNPLAQQNGQFTMDPDQQPAGDPNNPETAGLDADGRPLPIEQQQPTDYSNLPPGQVPVDAGQRAQAAQAAQAQAQAQQNGGLGYSLPRSRGAIGARPNQGLPVQPQQAATGTPAGFGMGNVSPDAASVIGRLLTTPRPGGLAGIQGQNGLQQAGQNQGQAFQEGIAGVATKAEEFGVKVYKGKNLYKEWEFVYDYRQDGTNGMGAPGQQQGNGNLNPNQPGLTAGGGLAGNPGALQQIPGMIPQQQPVTAAPTPAPQDGRRSRFGGPGGNPRLPSTGAYEPPPTPEPAPVADATPQEPPVEQPDASTPGDPTQTYPVQVQPDAPVTTPTPAQPPSRVYQLPKSRIGTTPNQPNQPNQ
jgi:hypothetical protein